MFNHISELFFRFRNLLFGRKRFRVPLFSLWEKHIVTSTQLKREKGGEKISVLREKENSHGKSAGLE